jgi:hypothetical protein
MSGRAPSLARWAALALLLGAAALGAGCTATGGTPGVADATAKMTPSPTLEPPCACQAPGTPASAHFAHVVIVVLENEDYAAVKDNPFFQNLAKEGVLLTDSHGVAHPSYPNYLAMITGQDFGIKSDSQHELQACTIGDTLAARGLTWRNYAEDYPATPMGNGTDGSCFTKLGLRLYARKHVPFMSFVESTHSAGPGQAVAHAFCANIVPDTSFAADVRQDRLPTYAFFSPNMWNDGHNLGVLSSYLGIHWGAKWLNNWLDSTLRVDGKWPKDTLVVVTFDESRDQQPTARNSIYTVLLGDPISPDWVGKQLDTYQDHFTILRTIEQNFGLCPLAAGDQAAQPIEQIWR